MAARRRRHHARRRATRIVALAALAATLAALGVTPARAAEVEVSVDARELYAELPFVLSVAAGGFAEEPTPEVSELAIAGCEVTYLGCDPNVSSFVQIVNGRMTESRKVTFVYRFRITPERKGEFRLDPITVTQGATRASSPPLKFTAGEVATSEKMALELALPARPIWVGETFGVTLDWYLQLGRNDEVPTPTFVVPVFDETGWFEVAPGEVEGARGRFAVLAGAREVELPYETGPADLDGRSYTRFRFHALVTATRAGERPLAPARVLARVPTGRVARDRFGFPVSETRLIKAETPASTLTVRGLPEEGRPESFSGAVGTGFTIEAAADRTVVRVGDPITLDITVRGRGDLAGVSLPRLSADGGPSPALFSLPDGSPPGAMGDDGAKRFRAVVRVKSDQAREIAPIAFSSWNPLAGAYETVRSRPIALSVQGSAVVGADQVVAATPRGTGGGSAPPDATTATPNAATTGAAPSLVGADLALSRPGSTLAAARDARSVLPLVIGLYAVGVLGLLARIGLVRTEGRRIAGAQVRRALRECTSAIDAATSAPAREGGTRIVAALAKLRRDLGVDARADADLLARCEALAFDPQAAGAPVPEELRAKARAEAERLAAAAPSGARGDGTANGATGALAVMLAVGIAAGIASAPRARAAEAAAAAPSDEATLDAARAAYDEALAATDRARRVAAFGRAEQLFGQLVERHPRAVELLADRGNAALGAHDLGAAVLAYRRALALDPDHARAQQNLAFVRSQMPGWLPRPGAASVVDSLFFWHGTLSLAERLLAGAAAFAAALLLAAPWGARSRVLRPIAGLPALIWIAMAASAIADAGRPVVAVVTQDATVLRSADSVGAPAAFARPLPAGAETTVLEAREGWRRVALADGTTTGWMPATALDEVEAP